MGIPIRKINNVPDKKSLQNLDNIEDYNKDDYSINNINFGEELYEFKNHKEQELLENERQRAFELSQSIDIDPENNPIRKTKKWQRLYKENIASLSAMKGGKKASQEAYLKLIDKIASAPPVNQNNIMASFPTFANKNFRYTSQREDD